MWVMSERPEPPPEGALITQALESKRPKLSVRAAAPRAGIGEARWRQIVKGYQTVSGTDVPVRAPDDTLARMAQVVGVTPEQLIKANRPEAAEELRNLPPLEEPGTDEPSVAELAERLERQERTTARLSEENAALRRMLREITGKDSASSGSLAAEPDTEAPRQAI
jgi:transposase-like protein